MGSGAKVFKCCPFGNELQFPSLECGFPGATSVVAGKNWKLRLNGHSSKLLDMIRIPYEKVVHRNLTCPHGSKKRLFDYEAFEVDEDGKLVFTRVMGKRRIERFCVDEADVQTAGGLRLMMAVFCEEEGGGGGNAELMSQYIRPATDTSTMFRSEAAAIVVFAALISWL